MKVYLLVNAGLEEACLQETQELGYPSIQIASQVIESSSVPDKILSFLGHLQTVRRCCLALSTTARLDRLSWEELPWEKIFSPGSTFKITVENVAGQENRLAFSKIIAGSLFAMLERQGLKPTLDMKKPELEIVAFNADGQWYIGVDLMGKEINARDYRVFPHQASFKGDLAYFFGRYSGFRPGERLLVGFCKDGAIGIEAALYASRQKVTNTTACRLPLFSNTGPGIAARTTTAIVAEEIIETDETEQNCRAARKNATLAGVQLTVQKRALDELDTKYGENAFDHLIFHITSKDEERINEIYHQAKYILKKNGTLVLITRKNYDLPLSSSLSLVEKRELQRGESVLAAWLLRRV